MIGNVCAKKIHPHPDDFYAVYRYIVWTVGGNAVELTFKWPDGGSLQDDVDIADVHFHYAADPRDIEEGYAHECDLLGGAMCRMDFAFALGNKYLEILKTKGEDHLFATMLTDFRFDKEE
jgi:hypothetical protein